MNPIPHRPAPTRTCGLLRPATYFTLLAALILASCDSLTDDLEPDEDSIPPEEVLRVYRSAGGTPLPANGLTRDTIYALLPLNADSRVVSFATSAGTLLPIPGAKTIDVRAEREDTPWGRRLVAKAVIQTDTIATTAVVSAKVGEFIRYLDVPFLK